MIRTGVTRRAVLRAALIIGGGSVLSACSPAPASPAPTTAAGAPATSASGAASPSVVVAPAPSAAASPSALPVASPAAAAPSVVAPSGNLTTFRGAWVARTASQMVWAIGRDAGYFGQHGVNMDWQFVNGSAAAIPALIAKDLDGVVMSGAATASAVAGGADLVVVSGYVNQSVFRIMALPEISSIQDLKQKTIAVSRVGATDYFAWKAVLERAGLQMSDVQFVQANSQDGQVALLQQKLAQAGALTPPTNILAEQAGAHEILDTTQLNDPDMIAGIVVTRETLTNRRPLVLEVLKGTIESIHRWKTDPAYARELIQKYLENSDPAVTNAGEMAYREVLARVPAVSIDALRADIMQVITTNPAAARLNPEQLADPSLVQELVNSGFIDSVYGPA